MSPEVVQPGAGSKLCANGITGVDRGDVAMEKGVDGAEDYLKVQEYLCQGGVEGAEDMLRKQVQKMKPREP